MRSNSKQVRQAINSHILENVTDYNGNTFATIQEAASHLNDEFNRVSNYPYNLAKFPNNQERFSDYLFGLPFSFHFSNYDLVIMQGLINTHKENIKTILNSKN